MQRQYNIANHTILPLMYRILGPFNYVSTIYNNISAYLLKDPASKSLFMFNPLVKLAKKDQNNEEIQNKYLCWLIDHIKNIQNASQAKLSHIVCSHNMIKQQYARFLDKLQKSQGRKQIKLMTPSQNLTNQIKPQVTGQISVCYIGAEGYFPSYNLIGVTHISPTSTKVPVLFVNDLLGICSVDHNYDIQYELSNSSDEKYLKSLQKVKYFPNETYIFPSRAISQADLLFAKAILSNSKAEKPLALLNQKISLFEKNNKSMPDCLIPTTVLQQKLANPFLNPQKYCELLGVKSHQRAKCFGLLRIMRRQWKM